MAITEKQRRQTLRKRERYTNDETYRNKLKINGRKWAEKHSGYFQRPEVRERRNKATRKWRMENPEKQLASQRNWRANNIERERLRNKKIREATREFKMNYKKDKCCALCGYKEHTEILHFHHNKGNKSFDISDKNQVNNEILKKEIEKCILLCPNCHAWIHFPQGEKGRAS